MGFSGVRDLNPVQEELPKSSYVIGGDEDETPDS